MIKGDQSPGQDLDPGHGWKYKHLFRENAYSWVSGQCTKFQGVNTCNCFHINVLCNLYSRVSGQNNELATCETTVLYFPGRLNINNIQCSYNDCSKWQDLE